MSRHHAPSHAGQWPSDHREEHDPLALQGNLPPTRRLSWETSLSDAALTSSMSWKRRWLRLASQLMLQVPHPGPRLHRLLLPTPLAMVSFHGTVFLQDDMWVKASSASVKQLRRPVSGMQHLVTLP